MTALTGYYRSPTLHDEHVVFVCEGDMWSVTTAGGQARRITANTTGISSPCLSPNGKLLAFVGRDEGSSELYVMPAGGGHPKRLTALGGPCLVTGWSPKGDRVLFGSMYGLPFRRGYRQWSVSVEGGAPSLNPIGPASRIAHGPGGGVVVGRNVGDPARWKRYRGGTAGDLWVDRDGSGAFARLITLPGNLADPMWIDKRIYFLSDHEGHGNVYSCTPQGEDLRRHTDHEDFYARNAKTDRRRIVYQSGAEVYLLDPAKGVGAQKLDIQVASARPQLTRRFASTARYLEDYELHPKGHSVSLVARGKSFLMANWEESVVQLGEDDGVRYRLTRFLKDGKRVVTVCDATGEEALEVHPAKPPLEGRPEVKRLDSVEIGRPDDMVPSPTKNQVVLTNHRHELVWADLDSGEWKVLDTSEYGRIAGATWSPDGRWVAYAFPGTSRTTHLRLARIKTGEIHPLTRPVHVDASPCFDPTGKYLYFVSYRIFNPVYDKLYFDMGFPEGGRLYLVTLRAKTASPLVPKPKGLDGTAADDPRKKKKKKKEEKEEKEEKKKKEEKQHTAKDAKGAKKKQDAESKKGKSKKGKKTKKGKAKRGKKKKGKAKKVKKTKIDLPGIVDRVITLPVPEGIYGHVEAIEGKVLYDRWPSEGTLGANWLADPEPKGELLTFDLGTRKEETFVSGVTGFMVAQDRKSLIYSGRRKLRVIKADGKPDSGDDKIGRVSGWLDLSRPKISVVPASEWRQMYREAWRLQRDQFWTADMSGLDWKGVYERYLPVLERVATRVEFSDLMWEVQGELGTSHAYEFGGDHRRSPGRSSPGFLGADLELKDGRWIVAHVVRGDSWNPEADSPLNAPGVDVRAGDAILMIDGRPLTAETTPGELLAARGGERVALIVQRSESKPREVVIETLDDEDDARYREWVEANRARVHEDSKGSLGYLHVPDMGARGFSEFHRYYQQEIDRPGLIVDVRYNGGGHVSQLLLEKLARKRIGYDVPRHGRPEPYPMDSVLGPIVCLTNEQSGSDGDIFSHCFKLMKLGTLIGKRTWGGVVGIWPRHPLVDKTITTQAEFAFWFEDVGWGVENYGTDPDIDIDITPQDWVVGKDPQLEKALEVALAELEATQPKIPEFGNRPNLSPPRLS